MKFKISGYTLIEMLVALSLMIIVLMGGTLLFTQNLRTGGLTEVDLSINKTSRALLDEFERLLRFGVVEGVDDFDKNNCLEAGSAGVSGSRIKTKSVTGVDIDYYLANQRVASLSGDMIDPYFLNDESLDVNSLQFQWFCQSGISDKIKIDMNVSSTVLGTGVTITKSVSRDILLLNGSNN